MFDHWYVAREHGGYSATARKFGRSDCVVRRIAKRDRWEERVEEIRIAAQREQDRKLKYQARQNLELVREIKNVAAERIKAFFEANPSYTPSLKTLIKLVELEEQLSGNALNGSADRPVDHGNPLSNIVQIITGLPAERRDELHDLYGKTFSGAAKRF